MCEMTSSCVRSRSNCVKISRKPQKSLGTAAPVVKWGKTKTTSSPYGLQKVGLHNGQGQLRPTKGLAASPFVGRSCPTDVLACEHTHSDHTRHDETNFRVRRPTYITDGFPRKNVHSEVLYEAASTRPLSEVLVLEAMTNSELVLGAMNDSNRIVQDRGRASSSYSELSNPTSENPPDGESCRS